jgi:uncharacterized protein with PIN domain
MSARVVLRRLEALRRRRSDTEATIVAVVGTARAAGASWSAVGAALGVSAQAAQQRYGPRSGDEASHQRSLSRTRHQEGLRTPRPATGGAPTEKGRRT